MSSRLVMLVLLAVSVLVSALGVVYAKHSSRGLFVELQLLNKDRDELEVNWGRLLLEQSTWAAPNRIESIARTRLQMQVPVSEKMVIMQP